MLAAMYNVLDFCNLSVRAPEIDPTLRVHLFPAILGKMRTPVPDIAFARNA